MVNWIFRIPALVSHCFLRLLIWNKLARSEARSVVHMSSKIQRQLRHWELGFAVVHGGTAYTGRGFGEPRLHLFSNGVLSIERITYLTY